MSVRLYISQKDIEQGKRWSSTTCPIANAVKRRCRKSTPVYVNQFKVVISGTVYDHTGFHFVRYFDRGYGVSPTKITIKGLDRLP